MANFHLTGIFSGSRILPILLLLALSAVACADNGAQPTGEEAAAVIRQIYAEDDTHGGTLQPPQLYIVGTTDNRAGNQS